MFQSMMKDSLASLSAKTNNIQASFSVGADIEQLPSTTEHLGSGSSYDETAIPNYMMSHQMITPIDFGQQASDLISSDALSSNVILYPNFSTSFDQVIDYGQEQATDAITGLVDGVNSGINWAQGVANDPVGTANDVIEQGQKIGESALDQGRKLADNAWNKTKEGAQIVKDIFDDVANQPYDPNTPDFNDVIDKGQVIVKDGVVTTVDLINKGIDAGQDFLNDPGGAVKDGAEVVAGGIKAGGKFVGDAIEAGANLAADGVEAGAELVVGAAEAGEEFVENVAETGTDVVENVIEAGEEFAENLGETANNMIDDTQDTANEVIDDLQEGDVGGAVGAVVDSFIPGLGW